MYISHVYYLRAVSIQRNTVVRVVMHLLHTCLGTWQEEEWRSRSLLFPLVECV